jgi:hypothetical protein
LGRARDPPRHDLLLDRHDFDALIGPRSSKVVQTRRIDADLAVADAFEHQGDFLDGRMALSASKAE